MKKLFVCFLLMGCAKGVYQTEVVEIRPFLADPAEVPVMQGNTNQDLLTYALRLENALRLCNARLSGE